MQVLGVDWSKKTWVAAVLADGALIAVVLEKTLAGLVARFPEARAIGVDIPISLPNTGEPEADKAARVFIGPRRSSVFPVPQRPIFEQPTYKAARLEAGRLGVKGITAQAFALKSMIQEADAVSRQDARVFEVHPEVSFRAMKGSPLRYSKKTWGGFCERRDLLMAAGLLPTRSLGVADTAGIDDVLDALAAGWSAHRKALGVAGSLPEAPPLDSEGRATAIWY